MERGVVLDFEEALEEVAAEGPAAQVLAAGAAPEGLSEAEQFKKKHDELSNRHLRLMADFDNFRKRNARERATERRYAGEPVLRELLEVVDNMDRAVAASAENSELLRDGVTMIRGQLVGLLARFGAKPFDSVDAPFDPEMQEAVANVPDHREEGVVMEELQKGYSFHDRLLRPARVVVSAGGLDKSSETGPNGGENE